MFDLLFYLLQVALCVGIAVGGSLAQAVECLAATATQVEGYAEGVLRTLVLAYII